MEVIMLCTLTLAVMDGYDFWGNVILHAMACHKEWAMSQKQELYWEWKLSQVVFYFPVNQTLERYFESAYQNQTYIQKMRNLKEKNALSFQKLCTSKLVE